MQAVLLAVLSARTPSAEEITQNLGTLIVTNMAYAVTTLVLGFTNQQNQLNLYDALVVLYLLSPSWAAIFFTMPQYNRHKKSEPIVKVLAIVQSYLLFACAFAILGNASTFGSSPECNSHLVFVIFRPFHVLNAGRNAFLVLLSIVALIYTVLLYCDYQTLIWRFFKEKEYIAILEKGRTTTRKLLEKLRLMKPSPDLQNGDAEKGKQDSTNPPLSRQTSHHPKHPNNQGIPSGTGRRHSGKNMFRTSRRGSSKPTNASTSLNESAGDSQLFPDNPNIAQPHTEGVRGGGTTCRTQHPNAAPSGRPLAVSFSEASSDGDLPPTSLASRENEDPLAGLPFAGLPSFAFDTSYRANINGRLIVNLLLILATSALAILNTELLRAWNHPQSDSGSSEGSWGFGQILPLFLTVLPAWNACKAFKKHGLGEKRKDSRKVRVKASSSKKGSARRPASPRRRPDPVSNGDAGANASPFSIPFPFGPSPFSATSNYPNTNREGTATQYASGAKIEQVEDESSHRETSSDEEEVPKPGQSGVHSL
ncbi:hypothetical protein GLOTRDRAFT_117755 [Gloeophyllum trabeum ATCC 11539]|uniref:Uncharacterized protein n=1 Tax=Gloeophyllum trabeum (strain ATCC 11539 / FP-39264 / Madison 617) TaxID=670483 RepID=S7PWI8_GLOTA|nr:uncharacterized protein GLOTRDRAFT_117755 [Gloeophyllum trabeum ATCC 11539]EPQ51727.1 hypothetical protein GLOTRDRAFT_117755 [Gloeophyllum trabeum ATCC 11539]